MADTGIASSKNSFGGTLWSHVVSYGTSFGDTSYLRCNQIPGSWGSSAAIVSFLPIYRPSDGIYQAGAWNRMDGLAV